MCAYFGIVQNLLAWQSQVDCISSFLSLLGTARNFFCARRIETQELSVCIDANKMPWEIYSNFYYSINYKFLFVIHWENVDMEKSFLIYHVISHFTLKIWCRLSNLNVVHYSLDSLDENNKFFAIQVDYGFPLSTFNVPLKTPMSRDIFRADTHTHTNIQRKKKKNVNSFNKVQRMLMEYPMKFNVR